MYVESKKHTGAELLRWFQDWPRMRKLTTVMGFFWMPSRNRSFEAFEATKYTLQMSRRMNYESVSHSNKKSLIFKKASTDILEIALVLNWTLARVQKSKGSTQNYKILCYYCNISFLVLLWAGCGSHIHIDTSTQRQKRQKRQPLRLATAKLALIATGLFS